MPGMMNRTQEPSYSGPAFYSSPSASALPILKRFRPSSNGSGAQCNAEKLGDGDGDKAVSVSSDKSHETKGTVSETKEQDRPVDTKPKPIFTASQQANIAFENLAKRMDDEDNGIGKKRQPVSKEEMEELRRRQQVIIDRFEAQTTTTIIPTIQAAAPPPPPQVTIAPRDHQRSTIPANAQRLAQGMQQKWMDEQIRTTGQQAAAWLAVYQQSMNQMLRLLNKRLEQNLARQRELRQQQQQQQQRPYGVDDEIERGQILAEENEGPRRTRNNDSNGKNGESVAGIEGESGLVTRTRQTSMRESEGTMGGIGMVLPKDTKDGEGAEEAEYSV